MNSLLKTLNLGKEYLLPKGVLRVFEGINFDLLEGDLVAIMGVSGVGKTTFLNLLGALDRPSEGKILFEGDDLLYLSVLPPSARIYSFGKYCFPSFDKRSGEERG
jgi:ABC-type lipoprotein export system ATPase subunit